MTVFFMYVLSKEGLTWSGSVVLISSQGGSSSGRSSMNRRCSVHAKETVCIKKDND